MRRGLPLVALGLAAGFLAALFGVGGGVLIVPGLVALGYGVKGATGTSLAAIGITAVFGAARYGWSGHVHWRDAVLVGMPAVVGATIGTGLQRKISGRRLQLAFSVFLAVVGLRLILV